MAKTFITSGTGASQTLDAIQNEKVPVYNTRADAEADISNIEEGGIVATKDTGATEKVVDVVQDGNMNPVTSNGVFDYMKPVDITSTVTINNTYCDTLKVIRSGNVIDVVFTTKNNVTESNAGLALGLPKPASGEISYGTEVYGSGAITYSRVERSGSLIAQCTSSLTGTGHVIYVCE